MKSKQKPSLPRGVTRAALQAARSHLARLGGLAGGPARAKALSPAELSAIGKKGRAVQLKAAKQKADRRARDRRRRAAARRRRASD